MNPFGRALAALAAVFLAHLAADAMAQEYPTKPIRLLIPFTPGGGTDFVSRIVAGKLNEIAKWNVVPENRPGAAGNLAIETAAKSTADGYTIVMGQTDNVMLGPWLNPNLGYDTLKNLTPIVQVSSVPLVIVSSAQSNLATPADLVARARSSSGLTWATAGNGSVGHLFGEQFQRATGVRILQVHYKGASPAMTDVVGGQVDVAIMSAASVLPLVRGGKLQAVAVSTAKRSPALPSAPTLDESVERGIDVSVWLGLFAPAGTPPSIIAQLNVAVNKVLASPDVIERISAGGVSVAGGTQEEFAALVRNDYARWGQTVKESGIKLD
jgi:tripartite-type tricarboxylate transporter receptor subunit TctC